MSRDPKGLYEKAQSGAIKALTGYDAKHEESGDDETLKLDTDLLTIEKSVELIYNKIHDIILL